MSIRKYQSSALNAKGPFKNDVTKGEGREVCHFGAKSDKGGREVFLNGDMSLGYLIITPNVVTFSNYFFKFPAFS